MTTLQDIITTALTTAAGTGGICFVIFKAWFDKQIAKQLENYRAQLNRDNESHRAKLSRDNELELAGFKHKLELAAAERNVQYSRVFERTAEVIAETYGKLLALKTAADDYTQPMEPENRQELANVYAKKAQEFLEYFLPRKIYIPKETAEKIRVFSNTVHRAVLQFSMAQAVGKAQVRDPKNIGKLFDSFFKSSDEVPKLLELLEDEFQKHLGFKIEEKSAKQ